MNSIHPLGLQLLAGFVQKTAAEVGRCLSGVVLMSECSVPGIYGAGGSMLGVRPFNRATSHLVDSDSGFAGTCAVTLLVADKRSRQPDAGLAAAPMSFCSGDVASSRRKSNRHKMHRLSPLPELRTAKTSIFERF